MGKISNKSKDFDSFISITNFDSFISITIVSFSLVVSNMSKYLNIWAFFFLFFFYRKSVHM